MLSLNDNNLAGPIPSSFLQLGRLRDLWLRGNPLCIPGTSAFTAWLRGITSNDASQVSVCSAGDAAGLE